MIVYIVAMLIILSIAGFVLLAVSAGHVRPLPTGLARWMDVIVQLLNGDAGHVAGTSALPQKLRLDRKSPRSQAH